MDAELILSQQEIINKLLRIPTEGKKFEEIFNLVLENVVMAPWMNLSQKGGIFLADKNSKKLNLIATYNFAPQLLTLCREVKFGQCLCGRAAESGEIVFKPCVDEHHDIRFDEMTPHGHYNVPIKDSAGDVIAVMVLYVPHGHESQFHEVNFLEEVAGTVSLLIERKRLEDELVRIKEKEALNALVITYNHEINNPLTIALGNFSKLKDHPNKEAYEKTKSALERIHKVVQEIRNIPLQEIKKDNYSDIGQILEISRDKNFPIHILSSLDKTAIISATDKLGNITYVNPLFVAISGYEYEELIGQNHRIIKSDFHPPTFYKEMWTTIAKGQIWRGEVCNKKKNGELYWVDSRIIPYLDGYISIRFDITKVKISSLF
ncbi:MAG: hypothetical protein OHK0056_25320 [Bacteriovoracaceae bacterium]